MAQYWIEAWAGASLATFVYAMYNRILHDLEAFTVGDLAKIVYVSVFPVINALVLIVLIYESLSDIPQWIWNTIQDISKIQLWKGKR
jgi:hypothetical protein